MIGMVGVIYLQYGCDAPPPKKVNSDNLEKSSLGSSLTLQYAEKILTNLNEICEKKTKIEFLYDCRKKRVRAFYLIYNKFEKIEGSDVGDRLKEIIKQDRKRTKRFT